MQGPQHSDDSLISRSDRITGSILGGAIGDCLGGPYEGKTAPIRLDERDDWRVSDDTILTLATCEAIIERGDVDPSAIAARFGALYTSGGLKGIGASTLKAVTELSHGGHWALVGRKGTMAASNGAAMRIAPVAFFLDPFEDNQRKTIRDICRITHHSEESYAGGLAIAIAIRSALDGRWPGQNGLLLLLERLPDTSVRDRIVQLAELRDDVPLAEIGQRFGSSGYVVESVPLAILGASRILTLGFREVLEELVMIGGDTDTVASMAGQIMGCVAGRPGIPDEMALSVPCYDRIMDVASRMAALRKLVHN